MSAQLQCQKESGKPESVIDSAFATAALALFAMIWILSGCSSTGENVKAEPYKAAEQLLGHLQKGEANDRFMEELYESRTWVPPGAISIDSIELGKNAKIPMGLTRMVENAQRSDESRRTERLVYPQPAWHLQVHADHGAGLAHLICLGCRYRGRYRFFRW
ncbi:hypothetical protein [Thiolapillus sp.]